MTITNNKLIQVLTILKWGCELYTEGDIDDPNYVEFIYYHNEMIRCYKDNPYDYQVTLEEVSCGLFEYAQEYGLIVGNVSSDGVLTQSGTSLQQVSGIDRLNSIANYIIAVNK